MGCRGGRRHTGGGLWAAPGPSATNSWEKRGAAAHCPGSVPAARSPGVTFSPLQPPWTPTWCPPLKIREGNSTTPLPHWWGACGKRITVKGSQLCLALGKPAKKFLSFSLIYLMSDIY